MSERDDGSRTGTVKRPSIADVQRMSRKIFGRTLTAAKAKAYRRKLPRLVENVRILEEWEGRLRDTEPATVNVVSAPAENQDDGC